MDIPSSLLHFLPSFISGVALTIMASKLLGWAKQRFFPIPNKPFVFHPLDGYKVYLGDMVKFTRKNVIYTGKLVAFSNARNDEISLGVKLRDRTRFELRSEADEWETIQ